MVFSLYKPKQGQIVRWGSFGLTAALFVFGMVRLYNSFPYLSELPERRAPFWQMVYNPLWSFTIPAVEIPIVLTPRLIFTLAFGAVLLLILGYLCFRNERISDFLIDTESEMRKVAWPTLREVADSSLVVIIVIIALGVYLFAVDIGLDRLLRLFFY